MPASTIINLTDIERSEFQRLCRSSKTPVRVKQRLSIVLLADEGLTNVEIADHVPLNQMTIGVCRNRFIEEGFDGIVKNRPRGATKNGARDDNYVKLRQQIIEITTTQKPEGKLIGVLAH